MHNITSTDAASKMNALGKKGIPYFFMFDFELEKPLVIPLDRLPDNIIISSSLFDNSERLPRYTKHEIILSSLPISFIDYKKAFDNVIKNINHGNSYLVNLTFPTEIKLSEPLDEIFCRSIAKYKLLYRDKFVVFSPETFVRIDEAGRISSYPMKGTIDASIPGARKKILEDKKEKAEHNTIVDLIRNDLSIFAENVKVDRYRYIDTLFTSEGRLLQVSSEISGCLGDDWKSKTGDIICSMLPAGSISGAPKNETLRIIKDSEADKRGYYTGVFGIFNGHKLDSGVMIRFIEQNDTGYVYRSGGGITSMSDASKEYDEMKKKIYVPVDRNDKS
ncbi:MAG: aminodeoxychorismate synthase component I [Bacteroidales bacterium]|nr:aminodeoxychorismate synthase component I [Bacteroidales bacterium]